jgi:tetratricopeptide (TPR) repeat protein
MSNSIFLSHSHADKPFARRLAQDLANAGVRVWIDDAEILIGDSLIEKIRAGIEEMDFLGVILSPHSVNSEWVKREVEIAMNEEIDGKRIKVLPLLYRQSELPGFLKGKKYADFTNDENYAESLQQVLQRLGIASDKSDKKSASLQKLYPKSFPPSLIYFTGREQVLDNITEALENHGTAAFADTHGVGKSSVVIEFAHRRQEKYKHILFIRATNNEFDIYVSDIVKELGFQLPEDAKPEQRLAVLQDWLAKNRDWLLLVDNVDDVDYIHHCGFNKPNGKVIYTSNDERIFRFVTKVELPKMTDENAMLLLYKHWRDNTDAKFEDIPEKARTALQGIAEKFGNHPFSMAFVGSYLAEEDESLEEFLEAYQAKEKNLLQTYEFLSNYQHKTVATAFLLRFEQISTPKDDSPREQFLSTAVKDYLKLSAYVGTDNIPEELLQQSLAKLHPDQSEWTENKDFIKDIYKRFKPTSIFKRDAENKTLTTHRIVQEIMRFQIKDEEDTLLEMLAQVLAENFEEFDFTNKENVERYLLHVSIFLEYLEQNKTKDKSNLKSENESTALLCDNYARYFYQYGQYKKAKKYFKIFKNICESTKDIDQNLLATSYSNLAVIYRTLINYEQAEVYFLKSIELEKKISTNETIALAVSFNQIAGLYQNLSKYKDAEFYYLEAVRIFEKINGDNHIRNCPSYNNLSGFYFKRGNLKLAKEYQQKSLAIRLAEFGENHPDVAVGYWWLGTFCKKEEKYQEALDYFYKAHEIFLRFFSKEHPRVQNLQTFIDKCERLVLK